MIPCIRLPKSCATTLWRNKTLIYYSLCIASLFFILYTTTVGLVNLIFQKLHNDFLNEISIIRLTNITRDIHQVERSANRTLNQEEYVAVKEKYYSEEYYRKTYCLVDVGDIQSKLNVQPVDDEECNVPLITINFKGRMGNQIGQYLSLFVLNTMYNASVSTYPEMDAELMLIFEKRSISVIPPNCENKLNRTASSYKHIYTYLSVERLFPRKFVETYQYDMIFKQPLLYVSNNPFPVHFFMKRRQMIRNELRLLPVLRKMARSKLASLTPPAFSDSVIVSIHVRRSDYLLYADRYSNHLLSMDYYHRAMDFFRNSSRFGKPLFMVFSDDLDWCKEKFTGKDMVIAGDADEANPFMDFSMISESDHHILGLGTFGFTAALLGKGLIVYPLPTVPRERVFSIPMSSLCSKSPELIPIPDIPLLFLVDFVP